MSPLLFCSRSLVSLMKPLDNFQQPYKVEHHIFCHGGYFFYLLLTKCLLNCSLGPWCYSEVSARWHHSAHGDRWQHQHSKGHCHQVWHHPPRGRLPLHRRQGVQPEDPQWERRGTERTVKRWRKDDYVNKLFFKTFCLGGAGAYWQGLA